jgi:NifU homolog involved in Fe-S cluster formation
VSYYPENIREFFLHPRNVGEVHEADAVGDTGSLTCGAILRLTIKVDALSHKVTDAKFKAAGCGYLIAAASVLTELIEGITMEEAVSLTSIAEEVISERLGQFPPEKKHCATLCRDALGAAITGYRTSPQTEWIGDEALICTCFAVSEKTIEQAIQTASLHTVEQVTRACNAGAGCGSCHPLIEDIIEDYMRTRRF